MIMSENNPWLLSLSSNLPRTLSRPTWAITGLFLLFLLTLFFLQPNPPAIAAGHQQTQPAQPIKTCVGFFEPDPKRATEFSIEEFGGVGDGKTKNTEAFRKAMGRAGQLKEKGGVQLRVPAGRWVTGSFNLTSNFTLYLEKGAVILGSEEPEEWPVIRGLPSYGRGRERLGGRHISLIHGNGLQNVVITGQNGSIDGQGRMWWELWWNRTLQHTRGHLLELVNSSNILITNVTFRNSPFWTIHPVYCNNVVIKNVTVLAPLNAPNTDGIDPDSSTNVCIEDCYIESGDDLVAIKSGWDQYGITMARPSSNIIVRRISGTTPTCSGVGIGSEMSGGISNILIEDTHIWNSAAGVRLKTDIGRGGYIENITVTDLKLERVKIPFRFSRGADDHPDDGWDRNAFPRVYGISIGNVVGVDIGRAPVLQGIKGSVFGGVCLRNITLGEVKSHGDWQCEYVQGEAYDVFPSPCSHLSSNESFSSSQCLPS